jgi:hypothetical protein
MLRMRLCLERMDKDFRLLERREQASRSFTRGLIELLYAAHLQPSFAVPSLSVDLDGVTRSIDLGLSQSGWSYSFRAGTGLLRIASGGGDSTIQVYPNVRDSTGNVYYSAFQAPVTLGSTDLGIMVGVDNTAVTPTDRRLVQRIGNGRRAVDGAPVLFDSYATGEDTSQDMNAATTWLAQEFIPKVSHRITSVWLKIYKSGSPGNLTVSIKGEDWATGIGGQAPNVGVCPDLASGTILEASIPAGSPGALTQCTFSTPIDVLAGHRYCIVVRALGSGGANHTYWRYDTAGATYEHALNTHDSLANIFTRRHTSTNSGVSWTNSNNSCFIFEEWGQSVGEFDYGGCEISGLTFVDPNGSFIIRRFFTNNSGGVITVQEVGIGASAVGGQSPYTLSAWPFLIARDVVAPGVAVNNTEILRVTYTPSITV